MEGKKTQSVERYDDREGVALGPSPQIKSRHLGAIMFKVRSYSKICLLLSSLVISDGRGEPSWRDGNRYGIAQPIKLSQLWT